MSWRLAGLRDDPAADDWLAVITAGRGGNRCTGLEVLDEGVLVVETLTDQIAFYEASPCPDHHFGDVLVVRRRVRAMVPSPFRSAFPERTVPELDTLGRLAAVLGDGVGSPGAVHRGP